MNVNYRHTNQIWHVNVGWVLETRIHYKLLKATGLHYLPWNENIPDYLVRDGNFLLA